MEDNKSNTLKTPLLKQFFSKIASLKTSVFPINKSKESEETNFKLYLERQETFAIEKDLSKVTKDIIKEFSIGNKIPEFAKDLKLSSGIYSYGVATNPDVDIENESVEIPNEVFSDLTKAPYNKVFMAHNKKDIASGVIQFAGVVNNDKVLLEKLNEAHPMFRNIAGSIANKNLDSYSVSGQALKENVFDSSLGRNITNRKVLKAHEVSRTSCPVNAGASIDGLFFVKSKAGGYAYSQEDSKMENTDVQAIQKSIADLSGAVEKSNTDMNAKMDGMAERLGVVETFQKSLKDEAEKLNKAGDGEDQKPADDDKDKDKDKDKKDADKKDADKKDKSDDKKDNKKDDDKDVKKSDTDKRLEKIEKSLLDHSKAIAKVPETLVKPDTGTPMLNWAVNGTGSMLGGH